MIPTKTLFLVLLLCGVTICFTNVKADTNPIQQTTEQFKAKIDSIFNVPINRLRIVSKSLDSTTRKLIVFQSKQNAKNHRQK